MIQNNTITLKLTENTFHQENHIQELKNLFKDENLDKIQFFFKKIIQSGKDGITYRQLCTKFQKEKGKPIDPGKISHYCRKLLNKGFVKIF